MINKHCVVITLLLIFLGVNILCGQPIINSQSTARQVLHPGQSLTLSVAAAGSGTLSYQWYKNNKLITGATSTSFYRGNLAYGDSGAYTVGVTDAGGTRFALMFVIVSPSLSQVVAWGFSPYGEVSVPAKLANAVKVSAGTQFSLVLKDDGTVVAWGRGDNSSTSVPNNLSDVVDVSAGQYHSLALKADGTVVAWGLNTSGETSVPPGLNNVISVHAGSMFSLALKADGTVAAWGYNSFGQSTAPTNLNNIVAISAGGIHAMALKADGTVIAWGGNTSGQSSVPAGLANVEAISCGIYDSVALKTDGTIDKWGTNYYGQLSFPVGIKNIAAISAGGNFSLALITDGTVIGCGGGAKGGGDVPAGIKNVVAVSSGFDHALVLRDASGGGDTIPVITSQPQSQTIIEGSSTSLSVIGNGGNSILTYQWRKNGVNITGASGPRLIIENADRSQEGNYDVVISNELESATSNIAAITIRPIPVIVPQCTVRQLLKTGQTLALNVTATGTGALSYQWYHRTQEIPGATNATYTKSVVTPEDSGLYTIAVTDSIGTKRLSMYALVAPIITKLSAWGQNDKGQCTVPADLTNVVQVAAGYRYSLALKADGTIVFWGDNSFIGTSVPEGLSDIVAVSANFFNALALKANGTVVAWNGIVPKGLTKVVAIAAGSNHSLALKEDGTIVAWGNNTQGEILVPEGLHDVVAIEGSFYSSLALKADGTVVAWGSNDYGLTSIPSGLSNVTMISAGGYHAMALKSDGTAVSWGRDSNGSIFVPSTLNNVVSVAAGDFYSIALKPDGTITAWGQNNYGQITPPDGLSKVFALGANDHVLALSDASNGATPPGVSVQPSNKRVAVGRSVSYIATITGVPSPMTHWQVSTDGGSTWSDLRDDTFYTGSLSTTLTISRIPLSMDNFQYRCILTNAISSTTTTPATLSVVNSMPSRLKALSVRTVTGPGADVLFVGVGVADASNGETKQLIARGVGPGLAKSGLKSYLADPKIWVYSESNVVAQNDDWDYSTLKPVFVALSLDNLDQASKDAAILTHVGNGGYPIKVGAETTGSGVVLAEIYETDNTTKAHMNALSVRAKAGSGEQTLIAGFIIDGTVNERLVIRGLGPALSNLLSSGYLSDPQIQVYSGQTVIASNDNWSASPEMLSAFASVGLTPMATNSKDSALVIDLPPGVYTVFLTGVNNTTGIGLIEIYELP